MWRGKLEGGGSRDTRGIEKSNEIGKKIPNFTIEDHQAVLMKPLTFLCSILFLFLFGSRAPHPNDTVLIGKGDHLVPVEETEIELKREVLNMKMEERTMHVDVQFEFFNPGEEKELRVGFVNPPVSEGAHDKGSPAVKDFRAIVNGEELEHEVERLGETGFQSAFDEEMADKDDFVNHFKLSFEPGLNVVKHRYSYGGSQGAMGEHRLHYRLTTGKNWANGRIGDFRLNLDMGSELFELTRNFEDGEEEIPWEVVGKGKLEELDGRKGDRSLLCYTSESAYLTYHKEDFEPDKDLSILRRMFSPMFKKLGTVGFHRYSGSADEEDPFPEMWQIVSKRRESVEEKMEKLAEYDASELRVLRNAFFAAQGYVFNDEELQEHFEQYIWYVPDPEVKPHLSILTEEQREWVERIKGLEGE